MRRRISLVLSQRPSSSSSSTTEDSTTSTNAKQQKQQQQQRWYSSPFLIRVISTCKRTASLSKKRVYSDDADVEDEHVTAPAKVRPPPCANTTAAAAAAPAVAANRRKRPRPFSADFTGLFNKHPPEDDATFRPSPPSPSGVFRRLSLFVGEPAMIPSRKQHKKKPPERSFVSDEDRRPRLSSLLMMASIAQQPTTEAALEMPLSSTPLSTEAAEMAVLVQEKQDMAVTYWCQQQAFNSHPLAVKNLVLPIPDGSENDNQERSEALCVFILNELYMTELSYHRLLTHMQQNYKQPMKAAIRNRDPLILAAKRAGFSCTRDVRLLFDYLSDLIRLSTRILDLLHGAVDIASRFLALKHELVLFLKYAIHYQTYFWAIRTACQTNPFLRAMEEASLSRRETNRMGLSDFLIAPIQRVPRYCLLFHDWLKHTPATDPVYPEIHACFQLVTSLASVMNMYSI